MIVQNQIDRLLVIRQTDHALLSGFLAREWGNDLFQRADLFESFCLAAREHDNGWSEWDLAPQVDPKSRVPYTFLSIPTEEHIAIYQRGLERLANADRYSALLASLHCAGLYDRSHATVSGYSAKYVTAAETQIVNDFLQDLRLQQLRLKTDLRANPATRPLTDDKSLEKNVGALDALDRLSLHFCLNGFEEATIDQVPLHSEREIVKWEIRPRGDHGLSLAPYPFRRSPLSISILARSVPKRPYGDHLDFHKTLARAPYFAEDFTLHAADEIGQTQSAVA
jgi:hypothetical protein